MINSSDIEFFTFFCGIQKSELDRLSDLVETFPYYNTHKLNVIDKSNSSSKTSSLGYIGFTSLK